MMSEGRICVTVTVRQAELSQGEMQRLYSVLRVAVICCDRVLDIESKRFVSYPLVPFRWVLHFALSLPRSIIVNVVTLYTRENPVLECSRPCDNLSCLCFTALWLQLSQSFFDSGKSASEGYRPDLLQGVPDQGHHMLTSGAHVPGLAAGSDCEIRSIKQFLLP